MKPLSVAEEVTAVRFGEGSAGSILDDHVARAQGLPDALGAFIDPDLETARRRACEFDNPHVGARTLAGLPVSIKDNVDLAGERICSAVAVFDDEPVAGKNAPAVARLRPAGAVLVERTNMVEFAFGAHGVNERFRTPTNQTSPDEPLVPGGSTSGGAVSVVADMATIPRRTDTTASSRIPAALCGVIGFKARRGLIPTDGVGPLAQILDVSGIMARSVDRRARTVAALVPAAVGLKQNELPRPRVAVLRTATELDPLVAGAFEQASAALRDAEFAFVDARVPHGRLLAHEAIAFHRPDLARARERYSPSVRVRVDVGEQAEPISHEQLARDRGQMITDARSALARLDAIVFPTVPIVAPAQHLVDELAIPAKVNETLVPNTALANKIDAAGLSIPSGAPGGIAVGLSLLSTDSETPLLQLAALAAQTVSPRDKEILS
jgi:aspartyl-tRNA(Asn)/glutamyl-tRNA(Gln) amidotransferase subunit A